MCVFLLLTGSCLIHAAPILFTVLNHEGKCTFNSIQYGLYPWIYYTLNALVSFVIPFMLIIAYYYKIWRALRNSNIMNGSKVQPISQEKQRATRIIIVLVFFFAICSLPRPILNIAISVAYYLSNYKLASRFMLAIYWCTLFLYINSAINPILYTLSSRGFRKHIICLKQGSSTKQAITSHSLTEIS